MLAIKDAESHGKNVKLLIEELLKFGEGDDFIGITLELLSSMKVSQLKIVAWITSFNPTQPTPHHDVTHMTSSRPAGTG